MACFITVRVFVWVALERQIFTAHPITAPEKETAFHVQTKTKAKEEKLKTKNPKQCDASEKCIAQE